MGLVKLGIIYIKVSEGLRLVTSLDSKDVLPRHCLLYCHVLVPQKPVVGVSISITYEESGK